MNCTMVICDLDFDEKDYLRKLKISKTLLKTKMIKKIITKKNF